MRKWIKNQAKYRLAHFFAARKQTLWDSIRQAEAIQEDVECLKNMLPGKRDITADGFRSYLDDSFQADCLMESVERHREIIGKGWEEKLSGKPFAAMVFCYAALRELKPTVVIETGCSTGWTSSLLLFALHCNASGHLFSIDIPPKAGHLSMDWTLPADLSPGFLVPDGLRDRWTLILGNTRDHMVPLLKEQREIGVFYHDSDHTYEHMMWEYTTAWPFLQKGGLLISDDIGWNTAFWDFAVGINRTPVIHSSNSNFGAISKGLN